VGGWARGCLRTQQRSNTCPARESNINRPTLRPVSIRNYAAHERHTNNQILHTWPCSDIASSQHHVQYKHTGATKRHCSQKVGVTSDTIGITTHGLSSSLRYTVVTMRLRSAGQISGLQIHQTLGNGHETQIQTAADIPRYWPKTTICVAVFARAAYRAQNQTKRYAVKCDELQRTWKDAFPAYCSTMNIETRLKY
jgi:hypothetical protein